MHIFIYKYKFIRGPIASYCIDCCQKYDEIMSFKYFLKTISSFVAQLRRIALNFAKIIAQSRFF